MGRLIDVTNQRFGRLLVLGRACEKSTSGNIRWNCICDCGNHVVADGYSLRHGITRSCGCLQRDVASARAKTNPAFRHHAGKQLQNRDGIAYSSLYKGKRNQTGVVGVSYNKYTNYYTARLMFHGKYVLNHKTRDFDEAVRLRKAAEAKYWHMDGVEKEE